jgi:hypothetical protein
VVLCCFNGFVLSTDNAVTFQPVLFIVFTGKYCACLQHRKTRPSAGEGNVNRLQTCSKRSNEPFVLDGISLDLLSPLSYLQCGSSLFQAFKFTPGRCGKVCRLLSHHGAARACGSIPPLSPAGFHFQQHR